MWKEDERKGDVEKKEKEKESLPIRHGKHHKSRAERKEKDKKKKKGFNPY